MFDIIVNSTCKRMHKEQPNKNQELPEPPNVTPPEIDYDKLADAIVTALQRDREGQKADAYAQYDNKLQEWRNTIGFIEAPENANLFKRKLHEGRSNLRILKRTISFKKKDAVYGAATHGLMRLALSSMIWLLKWAVYLVALLFVTNGVIDFVNKTFTFNLAYLSIGFCAFVFGRILRIAKFEVDQMTDSKTVIALLGGFTSFIALILAVIALFL